MDRLFDSAHIGMMTMPFDKKQVAEAIVETVRVNRLEACYIRPLVYIGYGAMGVYPGDNPISWRLPPGSGARIWAMMPWRMACGPACPHLRATT